eukprot:2624909-Amphidinium_carterae.1
MFHPSVKFAQRAIAIARASCGATFVGGALIGTCKAHSLLKIPTTHQPEPQNPTHSASHMVGK